MFIGHYAVGLAAKRVAPAPSLSTYFAATSFLDLLWPVFLLTGLEHVEIDPGNTAISPLAYVDYPISHSLLMSLVWATLFAGFYYGIRRNVRSSVVLWCVVFSHWLLDALAHRPDLPVAPGSHVLIGAGLWYSATGTILVEGALFVAGIVLYLRATRARDKTGIFSFWSLIVFQAFVYGGNLLGPPPPDTRVLAWGGLAAYLFVLWGAWIDRHRERIPPFMKNTAGIPWITK